MDWKDVLKKALEIVPGLGIALAPVTGGSSAVIGSVVGALTKAFGLTDDAKPEDVMTAITTDPEARLKLLLADNDFKLKQKDQEIEELKIFMGDIQSARVRDTEIRKAGQQNKRADVMLAGAFIAIVVIAVVLGTKNIDAASAIGGFLLTIGGMFARNIGTAFDFEFGSSRSSAEKTEMMSRLRQQLKA
jgi:hypothetical protein